MLTQSVVVIYDLTKSRSFDIINLCKTKGDAMYKMIYTRTLDHADDIVAESWEYEKKEDAVALFYERLAKVWKENCPDWRFGQFIINVFGSFRTDPWFWEEDQMIECIKQFFEKEVDPSGD